MNESTSMRVCIQCLNNDKFLWGLTANDPDSNQNCDYCDSELPTLSLETLTEKTDWLIEHYYSPVSTYDWYGEPEGYSLREVLEEDVSDNEKFIDDLIETLTDKWFDYSSHDHYYGEDPHFEKSMTLSGNISAKWYEMETKLRESVRFFNSDAQSTFDEVFQFIKDNHPSAFLRVTKGSKFYRGRIFQSKESLEQALKKPEDSFGPPPSKLTPAGRMNARGISVFYGATSKTNAVSEVRPPVGSMVVVAEFNLLRDVTLLDLASLSELPKMDISRFDPLYLEQYELMSFINRLSRKMVMPVVPELEGTDYLLTQAIADYLAISSHYDLDGILFPSAQKPADSKEPTIRNVILFHKSSRVRNAGLRMHDAEVELYEHEEEGSYFLPNITTAMSDFRRQFNVLKHVNKRDDTLEINLDNLEVHTVQGVMFNTNTIPINHYPRSKPSPTQPDEEF